MDKKRKACINLIISAVLLVCSLFVSVTSFGWFAFNDSVGGSGMGVVVKTEETNFKAVKYYNVSSETAYEYTAVSQKEATLGKYNLLSDKYQMLAKIYLKTNKPVTLTATTSTTYYLGSNEAFKLLPAKAGEPQTPSTSTAVINGETIEYTNALSSVVSFAYVAKSSLTAIPNGYSFSSLSDIGEFKTFIDKTDNSVKSSVNIHSSVIPEADVTDDGEACYSVMIVFSYDERQMSTVFSMNVSNELFTQTMGDVSIPFLCDFSVSVS